MKIGTNRPTGCASGKEGEELLQELMIEGIVLQATGVSKGEFSRIGSFDFYKDKMMLKKEDYTKEAYDLFLQMLDEHKTATAEAVCAEIISNPTYPSERYVITIV